MTTMTAVARRSTIYLDPSLYRILRVKALETEQTVSAIVNNALRRELAEDQEDLAAFSSRAKEPAVSYEALLKKLKADGKI